MTDWQAETYWPMAVKQVASGARSVARAVRDLRLSWDLCVAFLAGTLMHRMDQQQMKEVKAQEVRMSKVPLVFGASAQPVRGSPVPKTLCGWAVLSNEERMCSAVAAVFVIRRLKARTERMESRVGEPPGHSIFVRRSN